MVINYIRKSNSLPFNFKEKEKEIRMIYVSSMKLLLVFTFEVKSENVMGVGFYFIIFYYKILL